MSYDYEERKTENKFDVSLEVKYRINSEYLDLNETNSNYINYDDATRKAPSVLNKKKYAGFESRDFYDKTPLNARVDKMKDYAREVNFESRVLKDAPIPVETEYMRSRPIFDDIAARNAKYESFGEYFGYGRELLGDEKWKEMNEIYMKKIKAMREKVNADILAAKTSENLCIENYSKFAEYEDKIEAAKLKQKNTLSETTKKIFRENENNIHDSTIINWNDKNIMPPDELNWSEYKKESQLNESYFKDNNFNEKLKELIDETGKIKSELNNNLLKEISELKKELNKYINPKLEKPN